MKKAYIPNTLQHYPSTAENQYYRILRAIVRELQRLTREELENVKNAVRNDETDSERIANAIDRAFEESNTLEDAKNEIRRLFGFVDNVVVGNTQNSFKDTMSTDIAVHNSDQVDRATEEWTSTQNQLAEDIKNEYTRKLGEIISKAVQNGETYTDTASKIQELLHTTEQRARFIARNEIGNLNGTITRLRQMQAGIRIYRWSSSKDERVRPEHRLFEGRLFYWDRKTDGELNGHKVYASPKYHPSMDYNCRCVAIPVIEIGSWNTENATPQGEVKPRDNTILEESKAPNKSTGETIPVLIGEEMQDAKVIDVGTDENVVVATTDEAEAKTSTIANVLEAVEVVQEVAKVVPPIVVASKEEVQAVVSTSDDVIILNEKTATESSIRKAVGYTAYKPSVANMLLHEVLDFVDKHSYKLVFGGIIGYTLWSNFRAKHILEELQNFNVLGVNVFGISHIAQSQKLAENYSEVLKEYRILAIERGEPNVVMTDTEEMKEIWEQILPYLTSDYEIREDAPDVIKELTNKYVEYVKEQMQ